MFESRFKKWPSILLGVLLLSIFTSQNAVSVGHQRILADPAAPLETAWTHQKFGAATEYRRVTLDGIPAIRAVGHNSASGLYKEAAFNPGEYPWLEWSWRVDKLQASANIRTQAGEDMAASIFLIFGKPGFFRRDVPVLAYVWTNDKLPTGSVVPSPHRSDTMRTIVIESGSRNLGQWVSVRRNIVEDFKTAFGKEPPGDIEMIALWSDNDQTGEAVEAYYGAIRAMKE